MLNAFCFLNFLLFFGIELVHYDSQNKELGFYETAFVWEDG